ncbi:GDSL-type esterase/lipase family protein [Komagataeibacter rhaeticus]|uniref:GDSL-type esterase/lipase family protein n=1 Tax=Komagataeibacter rhaeticus TaxID=215221 RepID=UPI000B29A6D1|nr:GDSL-type esterase/lipase family protein [Komagataeibacter rhaeticus]GBQ14349.1 lipolytic protein G-D-S-L [Komagataeibacter rhaeticus DSM 16663]
MVSHPRRVYHARMRICFIGDSYVTGTGDETCQGWAGRLCAMERQEGRDVTLYNLGVRGQTGHDIARRWRTETQARIGGRHDGGIVLSFGVNDCTSRPDGRPRLAPEHSLAAACAMMQDAATAHWPVLMVGPPPTGHAVTDARTQALSHALGAACARHGVPFLPIAAALRASPLWCPEIARGDGAHPAGGGYGELARLVHGWTAWRAWMDVLRENRSSTR